jgi:hypothetical protein
MLPEPFACYYCLTAALVNQLTRLPFVVPIISGGIFTHAMGFASSLVDERYKNGSYLL